MNEDSGGDLPKKRLHNGPDIPFQLRPEIADVEILEKLSQAWKGDFPFEKENTIALVDEPFQLGKISGLLADNLLLSKLLDEMSSEVTWRRRETDFLELSQSCDLVSVDSKYLSGFYNFIKTDLLDWMKTVTGLDLTHVSASCSMYNNGDHLLVHDDCITDRKIAFVFYLSPWLGTEEWTPEMGGSLELFETESTSGDPKYPPIKKIPPKNNQFVFFKVSDKSFHQVGEVTSMNYPRLTINGWFHGPGKEFETKLKANTNLSKLNPPNSIDVDLSEWIEDAYLEPGIKGDIQKEIEIESQASLQHFLIPDFLGCLLEELKTNNSSKWVRPHSACEKNYETLDLASIKAGPIKDVVDLFQSPGFFKLLHEFTELDFYGENAKTPKCFVELQRWTNECYTMLTNESDENYIGNVLDVIFYVNSRPSVGTFLYANQSGDDEETGSVEEGDDVLLTVESEANSLNIVYCTKGVSRFGKYVSRSVDMNNQYVYILCCMYKE